MKKVLVFGASGATGRQLVKTLLNKNVVVTAIVRNSISFSPHFPEEVNLVVLEADITNEPMSFFSKCIEENDVMISCLGHNMTFAGVFGSPKLLVHDAIQNIVSVMNDAQPKALKKLILMSSAVVSNTQISEAPPLSQRLVTSILRELVPPHLDNEKAAGLLHCQAKKNSCIEWVMVRPDALIDEEQVSLFDVCESPSRNSIFNSGKTSRINVAMFMSKLVTDETLWRKWKGKMPVIYNII